MRSDQRCNCYEQECRCCGCNNNNGCFFIDELIITINNGHYNVQLLAIVHRNRNALLLQMKIG